MKTVTLKSFAGVKIGDTINFYSTKNHTKIIRRKVDSFPLSYMNEISVGIAFKIGKCRYTPLTCEILALNPQIKEVEKEAVIKLYKAIGNDPSGYGEVEFYQWILFLDGEEIPYSRFFSVGKDSQPNWYYNNLRGSLPKDKRQEVKNPKTILTT